MATPTRQLTARDTLLDTVTEMLDHGAGASSLTITDVVQSAGVSRPTFYKYFDDVPALVSDAALRRLDATFARIPAAATGASWLAFTRATFTTLLDDLAAHSQFYLDALDASPNAMTVKVVDYLATRLLEASPLKDHIRAGATAHVARERAEFLAAGIVWHVVHWLRTHDRPRDDVAAAVDLLTTLLLAAAGVSNEDIAAIRDAST